MVALEDVLNEHAGPRSVCITFDDGYEDNLHAAEALALRGMTATWFIVSGRVGGKSDWPESDPVDRPLMNVSQLRSLLSEGMSIGSHTVNHPRLPELDDRAQRSEIEESRKQLGDLLGSAPNYFAYPFGAFTDKAAKMVKSTGYLGALSTRSGFHRGDAERFRVRRLTIGDQDNKAVFARKLTLADNDGRWMRLFNMLRKNASRRAQRLLPVEPSSRKTTGKHR